MKTFQFKGNSSEGGKIGAEAGAKLACKTDSAPNFTSDGYPMLLDRFFGQEDAPSEQLHYKK